MRGLLAAKNGLIWLGALVILFGNACDESGGGPCPGGCPVGQICDPDQGICLELRPEDVPVDLGRYLSVKIDASGRRIFAAYAKRYGDLVFAREKGDGTFEYEYVDGVPFAYSLETDLRGDPVAPVLLGDDVGLYASLALGPLDRPHIAYFDRSHGRLKYAHRKVDGWEVVTVPQAGETEHLVGRAASLALDAEGLPRIAYLDEDLAAVKVARKAADGRWAVEVVSSCPPDVSPPGRLEREIGRSLSLVLDRRGGEWLAMRDPCTGMMRVAYRSQATWSVTDLEGGLDAGTWIAAALDAQGNVALAYHDRASGSLNYAWNSDGTMRTMVVDAGEEISERGAVRQRVVGSHCHLVFGPDGRAVISYLDAARQDLRLVHGDPLNGFSAPETLLSSGPVGLFSALVFAKDRLWVSCFSYGRSSEGRAAGEVLWAEKALVSGRLP